MHDIRYRLLRERLKQMAAATERMHDEDGVRLTLCCLALLDWHQVDKKGRCQYCRTRRGWRPWSRRCTVVPVVGFYLEQPSRTIPTL
jgi:hypothetical protein